MTFAELKARIVSTLYLPLWLRGGIETVQPITVQPKIEPAPEGTPKWCPFVRAAMVKIEEDSIRPSKSPPHNRRLFTKVNADGVVEIAGSSIESAYCIGDRCAVWDAKHLTCGLRNPLLHVATAVEDAKAYYDLNYGTGTGDAPAATDGTGDA